MEKESEKFSNLLNNICDGIFHIQDYKFVYMNPGLRELLGYTQDEPINLPLAKVIHESSLSLFLQRFEMLSAGTATSHRDEITLLKKDDLAQVRVFVYMAESKFEKESAAIGVITNITDHYINQQELQVARDKADKANKIKSEFLSRMSHELRTPMNAILGFTQFLQQNQEDLNEDQKQSLQYINTSGLHLLEIINEVLDLSRIESGKLDLFFEDVQVQDIVEECRLLVESMAGLRDITVSTQGSCTAEIWLDRLRLKQVLLNLLTNAIKYNKTGGTVSIECSEHTEKFIRISVADNGIGIPEEKQVEVFEAFARFAKNEAEGTGIGLTITKHLVESMGGRIGFNSQAGTGSTFWIEFPASVNRKKAAIKQKKKVQKLKIETLVDVAGKILYVEDTPANVHLMRMIMKRLPKVELIDAQTAELGIEMAKRELPDLILLDIDLPDMNGIDALKIIKQDPALCLVPVIALSATVMQKDIELAMQAGFDAYITKPFNIQEIPGMLTPYLQYDGDATFS